MMTRIKAWEELTIQDNFLFQKVMQNKRICKHLLESILNIHIQNITYPDAEKTLDIRVDSKSIRLDIYVEDDKGTVYDIEMQCTSGADGELAKRTRYYQGMIDMALLGKGKDTTYDQLNTSFIIFICTFDLFGKDLPMYTFRHRCVEDDAIDLGDEATIIFLNSTSTKPTNNTDLDAFLQYVNGKAAEGKFAKNIATEVARIKEQKETRREYMTLAMELKMMRKEGRKEEKYDIAKNLMSMGLSKEDIMKATGLSEEEINMIIASFS